MLVLMILVHFHNIFKYGTNRAQHYKGTLAGSHLHVHKLNSEECYNYSAIVSEKAILITIIILPKSDEFPWSSYEHVSLPAK